MREEIMLNALKRFLFDLFEIFLGLINMNYEEYIIERRINLIC